MLDPTVRPKPKFAAIVHLLHEYGVDWVLTGSAVLAIYGADLAPNDIDVTPSLDAGNLARLGGALHDLRAIPAYTPEWRDDFTIESCRAWRTDPPTEQNLDYLFVTRFGMVDVPPRLCGTYDELLPDASRFDIAGVPVIVCDPAAVLSRLAGRNRAKDAPRAAMYDAMRRQVPGALRPTGIDRLVERLP